MAGLGGAPSVAAAGTPQNHAKPVVVDVTGDAKNDLVIIVHDRILVYPQE
jgi:hypothetical protein